MRSRVLIAVATVVLFAAGYFARMWIECYRCKVPPAPALLGEISPAAKGGKDANRPDPLPNPEKIAAQLQKLGPQIEAFQARIEQIDAEMLKGLHGLLRADQEPLWAKMMKRDAAYRAKEDASAAGDGFLTPEQIANLQQRPLYKLLAVVVVPEKISWLTHDLKLDEGQQAKARTILLERRREFLELIDTSPPPSLSLSRLMPLASRIGEPKTAK